MISFDLDFELYSQVEHNRTLVHAQASAILSFIQGNPNHGEKTEFVIAWNRLDQWF